MFQRVITLICYSLNFTDDMRRLFLFGIWSMLALCILSGRNVDNTDKRMSAVDCDEFYREHFDSIAVKGQILKKEVTDSLLFIYVQDEEKGVVQIKLLKNRFGFQIYNFAQWGSDVLKYAWKRNIHIRIKYPDGSMMGKVFFDFCSK